MLPSVERTKSSSIKKHIFCVVYVFRPTGPLQFSPSASARALSTSVAHMFEINLIAFPTSTANAIYSLFPQDNVMSFAR
jgi:hypothetical protein